MSEQVFLDIHFSFKNSSFCLLPIFVKNAVIDSVIQPQSLVNFFSIIFHVGDSGIREHNASYNFFIDLHDFFPLNVMQIRGGNRVYIKQLPK